MRLLLRRGKRLGSSIPWQPVTRRRCQNLTRKGDNNKNEDHEKQSVDLAAAAYVHGHWLVDST